MLELTSEAPRLHTSSPTFQCQIENVKNVEKGKTTIYVITKVLGWKACLHVHEHSLCSVGLAWLWVQNGTWGFCIDRPRL